MESTVVQKKVRQSSVISDVFVPVASANDRILLQNILTTVMLERGTQHEPHIIPWSSDTRICLEFHSMRGDIDYSLVRSIVNLNPLRIVQVIVGVSQIAKLSTASSDIHLTRGITTVVPLADGDDSREEPPPTMRMEVVILKADAAYAACDLLPATTADTICEWHGTLDGVDEVDRPLISAAIGQVLTMNGTDQMPILDVNVVANHADHYVLSIRGLDTVYNSWMAHYQLSHKTHAERLKFRAVTLTYTDVETVRYEALEMVVRWRKSCAPIRVVTVGDNHLKRLEHEKAVFAGGDRSSETARLLGKKRSALDLDSESEPSSSDDSNAGKRRTPYNYWD